MKTYLRENILPLFLSLLITMIGVASYSSGQEVQAQLILKESVSDIQAHTKCYELTLPWVEQNCLTRIHRDKAKYCYNESCKKELEILKSKIKDTTPLKILFLGLLISTILFLAELLKWIYTRGKKEEYNGHFINKIDMLFDSIGFTKENLSKRTLKREIFYIIFFTCAFLCFWGFFFFLALLMRQ